LGLSCAQTSWKGRQPVVASASASMTIHDYKVTGAYLPTNIVEQAKQFIERNHDILLASWNGKIDTAELIAGLRT
jgi:hypothetical protein